MISVTKKITESLGNYERKLLRNSDNGWAVVLIRFMSILIEVIGLFISMVAAVLESMLKSLAPPNEKSLNNEIVIITGAGHGIGREIALLLAAQGSKVICWDKNEQGNLETAKILNNMGYVNNVFTYTCDVSKRDEVFALADKVEKEVGPVSVLINNAGILTSKPFLQLAPQHVERMFGVNMMSQFWTVQAFLPGMLKRNKGHIVGMCSMCGIIGLPNAVAYSASKFAVRGFMEGISEEMRRQDPESKVRFSTIYPFTVDTGLAKKPRVRFPSITSVLTPKEVASQVVRAIQQEIREITVPTMLLTIDKISRLFPVKVSQQLKDFLDSGVDPED